MIRCVVCSRPLRDPESEAAGVGPKCAKRLDDETRKEIREVIREGYTPKIIKHGSIQCEIKIDGGESA